MVEAETSKKETTKKESESGIRGVLTKKGVKITKKSDVDVLSQKGYGVLEKGKLTLTFYEALYLVDKGLLEVKDKKGSVLSFQKLLELYEKADGNAWAKYLTYRDLRSRGYVVREGFGLGVNFRLYKRGEYSKDTAKYMLLSVQEGKPVMLEELADALRRCRSLKKELILAVMNRRGEIVYYSVEQLTLPDEVSESG
ncbi:MAG: tRNA-intron lyase [Candidatus Bathyarchaeia archaeon]